MTVTIHNTFTTPDGRPIIGATIKIQLIASTSGTVPGTTATSSIGYPVTAVTNDAGLWSVALTPNTGIEPSGTYYQVSEAGLLSNILVPASGGPYDLQTVLVSPPPALGGTYVPTTRQILTDSSLTGGGDLSQDRTLAVVDDTSVQQVTVARAGTVVATRPKINLISGSNVTLTVADNPGANRVDVTVTATGISGTSLPSVPLFNVENYGAVGDGTTDDYAAFLAAWNAGIATGASFLLMMPRAVEYRVSVVGRLGHSGDGQYAVFPIPRQPAGAGNPKLLIGLVGPGQAMSGRLFSGGDPTDPVTDSAVIKVTYASPFVWSTSYGMPSLFGGPDADFNGATANVHWYTQGVTIRQPANPSLCNINLEGVATCNVVDYMADTTGDQDTTPQPAYPTGAAILWPRNGNAAVLLGGAVGAWGYFAGVGFGEHLNLGFAYALRCRIAHPIRRGMGHAATIRWTTTEECQYVIAGYDPSDRIGVVGVPSGGDDPTIAMWLSLEDYGYPSGTPWYYATLSGTDIYDPSNNLRGIVWFERSDAAPGGDGPTTTIIGRGGSHLTCISLRNGATQAITQQYALPYDVNGSVAGAPTIGTATAGDAQASVTFTAPADDGGAPITGYTATSTPGSLTGTAASSPVTVTGLTNETAYTFRVVAVNHFGNSTASSASNSVTPHSVGPITYASDNFDRANSGSTLGTSSGGQLWTAYNGTWGIATNKAKLFVDGGGDSYNVAALNAAQPFATYTIKVTPKSGPIDLGVAVMLADISNFVFWDISGDGSGTCSTRLFKRVAGSFTGITSSTPITVNASTEYTLKVVTAATVISCYLNDVLVFASSGATGLEANTRYGFVTSTASSDTGTTWNDLSVTNGL